MGQQKTLGGDRLGAGNKMKVNTPTFNRSTHDMGYVWRSTMSAGTLVPFMSQVVLPADNIEINLGCEVLTLPTVGPLFGSMKVQLDVFTAPIRLYQGKLHNNKLGIGLNMSQVKLPTMEFRVQYMGLDEIRSSDLDNLQVSPSSIISYLGIRGFGILDSFAENVKRKFNAVPLLAYWDIYKNYYSNKQEGVGYVISNNPITVSPVIVTVEYSGNPVTQWPVESSPMNLESGGIIDINTTALLEVNNLMLGIITVSNSSVQWYKLTELFNITSNTAANTTGEFKYDVWGDGYQLTTWRYANNGDIGVQPVQLAQFSLDNIDAMREAILEASGQATPFSVNAADIEPYSLIFNTNGGINVVAMNQEGLGVKTYQSDLFNNWLDTEYIDGVNGIAAVTAVSTVGDEFTIDSLILHKKVYDMLNAVMVSGGTYDDWQEVVYDHQGITRAETPIYYGSLIKELQFQEVISNAEAGSPENGQPLGTLAGRGRLGSKHKGGNIHIKVDEISYLMGIVSITPRIDYSQGNSWDVNLETMDDFHKPHMDEIGFQELITEQMAWWDTHISSTGEITRKSAGKQPAWINYMTNVNQIRGNFGIANDSMFMVLNRRYEPKTSEATLADIEIKDLTTYIDPAKYNNIFAQTSLDSQNFWVQIGVDMTMRRKLSARVMPNL